MARSVLVGWRYEKDSCRAHFCGDQASLKGDQPVVWIVLAPFQVNRIEPESQRFFPAVLDTGYAGRVLLNEGHLNRWTGIKYSSLSPAGRRETVYGQSLSRFQLKLWLLCCDPTVDHQTAYRDAFPLWVQEGVTIQPQRAAPPWNAKPELPLLGLRLLADNFCTLKIDAHKRIIDLATDRRW